MKENDVSQHVITTAKKNLESLTESFARYYPATEDPRRGNVWIIKSRKQFKYAPEKSLIDFHMSTPILHY